jgi:hypothetical protein
MNMRLRYTIIQEKEHIEEQGAADLRTQTRRTMTRLPMPTLLGLRSAWLPAPSL